MTEVKRLTEIDLENLQLGERLTIYRGSSAFLTGPSAAGYVGTATVTSVRRKSADIHIERGAGLKDLDYRIRFKDGRIVRVPNGETTALYVHARGGRPTVTAYFTDDEYKLVKDFLAEEATLIGHQLHGRSARLAMSALDRMEFHDALRRDGR